jgi:hypothetical protein
MTENIADQMPESTEDLTTGYDVPETMEGNEGDYSVSEERVRMRAENEEAPTIIERGQQ